jgi:hypothetical protein
MGRSVGYVPGACVVHAESGCTCCIRRQPNALSKSRVACKRMHVAVHKRVPNANGRKQSLYPSQPYSHTDSSPRGMLRLMLALREILNE